VKTDQDNTITVELTIGVIVKTIGLLLLLWLAYYLSNLVIAILTSVVVASALEPFINWFRQKKVPRVLAVVIVYSGLIGFVFLSVFVFLPLIFDDFFKLFTTFPAYIKSFDVSSYVSEAPGRILTSIQDMIADSFSVDKVMPGITSILSGSSGNIINTAKAIFDEAIMFVLVAVFSFYFAVQENGIEGFLRLVSPLKYEDYVLDLWKRSRKKIGLWMQGQILLGVLIGVFVFLGLSIIGVKNALALAVFASVIEIIPVFGPILAAFPAVVLAFIQSPSLGFFVVSFYIIIQQFENHLIYPLVVRKIIGIPPLVSILFLIVGWELAGFFGIILSIPAAVILIELAEDFEKKKRFVSPTK
jgi:predicted PurR-regulated permease PerM